MEHEKIQPQELEELRLKHDELQKVILNIANNFVTEQRVIEDKPRLMHEQRTAEAEYNNTIQKIKEKYGSNIGVDLGDGTITYK